MNQNIKIQHKFIPAAFARRGYTADAISLFCGDRRFEGIRNRVYHELHFRTVDPIQFPGGAKWFSPAETTHRTKNDVLQAIEDYQKLHHARTVILECHRDCGACGGSGAFQNTHAELAFHEHALRHGRDIILKKIPGIHQVILVFADFKGIRFLE